MRNNILHRCKNFLPGFLSQLRILNIVIDLWGEEKANCKQVPLNFSNEILNLLILKGIMELVILLTTITPQSVLEEER